MKKYRPIWMIILLILVVGSAVTLYVQSFISRKEAGDSLRDAKVIELERKDGTESGAWPKQAGNPEDFPAERNADAQREDALMPDALPEVQGVENGKSGAENGRAADVQGSGKMQSSVPPNPKAVKRAAGIVEETTAAAENEPENMAETAAADYGNAVGTKNSAKAEGMLQSAQPAGDAGNAGNVEESADTEKVGVLISPLTGSIAAPAEDAEAMPSYEEERIRLSKRIADLEKQIAARWKNDTDDTMTSKMNTAEYENTVWEKEMTQTLALFEKILENEQHNQLMEGQAKWMTERGVKAAESSARYKDSSRESLEYTKASSTLTKKRVLQLINTYLEKLSEYENKE